MTVFEPVVMPAGACGGCMEEPDGFREFVDAHSRGLLRAGWLLTGNWASAEDLVQTALAAAWPRWATIRRVESAEAYVHKIMVTTFLRWQRRRWVGEIPTNPLPDRQESADAWGWSTTGNRFLPR